VAFLLFTAYFTVQVIRGIWVQRWGFFKVHAQDSDTSIFSLILGSRSMKQYVFTWISSYFSAILELDRSCSNHHLLHCNWDILRQNEHDKGYNWAVWGNVWKWIHTVGQGTFDKWIPHEAYEAYIKLLFISCTCYRCQILM
jgi:hypothetical protein